MSDGMMKNDEDDQTEKVSPRFVGWKDRRGSNGTGHLHAHWDCFSGAAGDMMLAACLDAAGDDSDAILKHVQDSIRKGLPELAAEFSLECCKVWRGSGSIAALHVAVNSIYHHAATRAPAHSPCGNNSEGIHPSQRHDHSHEHAHFDAAVEKDHNRSHAHRSQSDGNHDHHHSHNHKHGNHGLSAFPNSTKDEAKFGSAIDHYAHDLNTCHPHSDSGHNHVGPIRNLSQIRKMLLDAPEDCIPQWVREKAIAAFSELALAEAAVHGADSVDAVHFHEVGAVDSIVDTVGTLLALYHLGVETVSCSRLPLGEGTVKTAHGILPVPAPATLRLMMGMPTTPGPPGLTGELVTPTAAALLHVLRTGQAIGDGRPPRFTLRNIGIGAGTKDFQQHPNIVRLLLGDCVLVDDRSDNNDK